MFITDKGGNFVDTRDTKTTLINHAFEISPFK